MSKEKKTILMIVSRVPWPLEKGDKLRAYYQIRELSRHYHIVLCALSDIPPDPDTQKQLSPYVRQLHIFRLGKAGILLRLFFCLFTSGPFQVAYFTSSRVRKKIAKIIQEINPDYLYCQLIRTAEYAGPYKGISILDYQDAFATGLSRRANISPWYLKPLIMEEHRRVRQYETKVFKLFGIKTIISEADRKQLNHPEKEKVLIVPNGVDTDVFKATDFLPTEFDLIFTGNMGYPPNILAARFLVNEIMPLVWAGRPETRLVLAGANPSSRVKALASERVSVTGWVKDIRHYYARSGIFIAPMQIGTGLQNKILEAMAMRKPCICSLLANQGIRATNGDQILLANTPPEYAQHILSLLRDPEKQKRLGLAGHQFVNDNYGWDAATQILLRALRNEEGTSH